MKSKINTLADYREAPFEKDMVIQCPKEYVQNQMKHLTRRYKKTEPVDTLEQGDVTVLSLESSLDKFNKPAVFVTVGGGLFDKAFEEKLIGRSVGATFEVTVEDMPVKVTVKQANRTVFPQPTDEMAAAYGAEHDGFSEITTVEAYRNHVIDEYVKEQRQGALYRAMDDILAYVLTHSDWDFDEEELQELVNEEKGFINGQLKEEGSQKTLEELSEEELQRYFQVESYAAVEELLKNGAEQRVAMSLWLAAINGVDATDKTPDEIEGDWKFLETYVKENLNIKEEL